jgi:hypothetical protein
MTRRSINRLNSLPSTSIVSTVAAFARRAASANLLLVVVIASGCGLDFSEQQGLDTLTRVRPRVVIDGLVELSGRTDGRLFVDEVVIHAGRTELRNRTGLQTDLLASDPSTQGPLVFRYKVGHSAASSTSVGVERDWNLTEGDGTSDLAFGFSPFSLARDVDPALSMNALGLGDIDLRVLDGATAIVHGFVGVLEPAASTNNGHVAMSDGSTQGGDPDGSPARDPSNAFGGDPDGSPARPENDGSGVVSGGDPDGSPARGGSSHPSTEGGDPDGSPARGTSLVAIDDRLGGDPDGSPAKIGPSLDETVAGGDPDGSPARSLSNMGPTSPLPFGSGLSSQTPMTLVPFVLIIDDEFSLTIPFASLRPAGRDQVLPIDVHVAAQHLFTTDLLRVLMQRAAAVDTESSESVTLSVDAQSSLFDVTVAAPVTSAPTSVAPDTVDDARKLTIAADRRDEESDQNR